MTTNLIIVFVMFLISLRQTSDLYFYPRQNELIIAEPRRRKQTKRYGGHHNERLEAAISDLESSSDSDEDDRKLKFSRGGKRGSRKRDDDFEVEDNLPPPGCYARPECFKVCRSSNSS